MLPIHVINLAREPGRLARIGAALDGFGLGWSRVEAIDRLAVPDGGLRAAFGSGPWSAAYPATAGDMACSLTHRRLWEVIAGGRAEAAVVLEDDARLAPGFPAFATEDVARLMAEHGMGVLKLEFWPGPQASRRFPLGAALGAGPAGATLYRLRSGFLGTCGYVLTAAGAGALLARFPALTVPVDHVLFGRSAGMGFDLLAPGFVNPAPVLHDIAAFGSDIRAERQGEAPRTVRRRWRDWRAARAEAREVRSGLAAPVEMTSSCDENRSPPSRVVSP
ncbi:glycosyltransferase family 25 protein [Albidovulum sp.]|uniref:glycosyltransferase family 25 protein n=1 Tax=Albidovulum sp. TaxID=1872424 RepID=UPI0039B95637